MREHGSILKTGLSSAGYFGVGHNYAAGGAERCDRKSVELHGRYVEPGGMDPEAQLSLSVTYIYPSHRSVMFTGGITLVPTDARNLALAIAPPDLAHAYRALPQLVRAVKQLRDQLTPDQVCSLAMIDAALAAAIFSRQQPEAAPC